MSGTYHRFVLLTPKNSRKLVDTQEGCSFKNRKAVLTEREDLKAEPWDLEDLVLLGQELKGTSRAYFDTTAVDICDSMPVLQCKVTLVQSRSRAVSVQLSLGSGHPRDFQG